MKRTTAREIAMHLSYASVMNPVPAAEQLDLLLDPEHFASLGDEDEAYAEYPDPKQEDYIRRLASGVTEHGPELDAYIQKYAKNWKFERISRVCAAILRIAMYEILYLPEVPYKAAVNEAVNLAKLYEDSATASFVNGILASFIREEKRE
jgi:N utilization substance protein B